MAETNRSLVSYSRISSSTLRNEVSEYNETVVAVRNKAKVEYYRLVSINNLNLTILNWDKVSDHLVTSTIILNIVYLQSVTKVYIGPINAENVCLCLKIIYSTIGAIPTVQRVVAILACTCCKLVSADRKLEVNLATSNNVASLEVVLARCQSEHQCRKS